LLAALALACSLSPLAEPPTPSSGSSLAGWQTYQSGRYHYAIQYPPGATVEITDNEHARIDLPTVPGTNLIGKVTEITALRGVSSCPAQYGALQSSENVTVRGLSFLHETGLGVALGTTYDWQAYSTTKNNICVNLTFLMKIADPGNEPTPPARFDRAEETKIFPVLLSTFTWTNP
jgi:hypothetical protein